MAHIRILVVEDNPDERQLVGEAFASTGHTLDVAVFGNATEALAFLEGLAGQPWPRLMITDHHLPDLSGRELIARLRRHSAATDTQMILLSGDTVRPDGLADATWYGKPDSWQAWCCWAEEMARRCLPNDRMKG